jgi:hypothetical protein
MTRSTPGNIIDATEIRRLVQIGKDRGLIRGGDMALPILKNGEDAAQLGGVRSQWMDVDPKTAKTWLENNFRNRPLKDDVVQAYARDMINGVWVATHQGVAFNDKDELIDGQHRLNAIVLSGVTVRMMATFGLPSSIAGKEMTTMDAVDRGRTRSVADQLTIQHGFKNGSITASICASIAGICYGQRTRRLSVGQTIDIFRAFEHPIHWVILHRSRLVGLRTAGVLAGFAFALATEGDFQDGASDKSGVDRGPVSKMFDQLLTGDGLKATSPIGRLRQFLTSDDAKLLTRGTDRGVAELVLQAVFLESKGSSISKLEMSLDGVNHFRAKQKDRVMQIAALFSLPKPLEPKPVAIKPVRTAVGKTK